MIKLDVRTKDLLAFGVKVIGLSFLAGVYYVIIVSNSKATENLIDRLDKKDTKDIEQSEKIIRLETIVPEIKEDVKRIADKQDDVTEQVNQMHGWLQRKLGE